MAYSNALIYLFGDLVRVYKCKGFNVGTLNLNNILVKLNALFPIMTFDGYIPQKD
jgi:hypothetical protein